MTEESVASAAPVVVVVEGHPELREVMLSALGEAGYEVLSTRDRSEAITVLGERGADLLVMDAETPADLQALERIEADHGELRTIVLSEDAGTAGIFFGPWETTGARRTLRRPFRLADLIAAAREALEDGEASQK